VTTVAIAAMMSIRERESFVRDISPFCTSEIA
jgi:hypothetical protein